MQNVKDLPTDVQQALAGRDLILFDGECVFCSTFFKLMVRLDRQNRFCFTTAQSEFGQALYSALGLSATEFETNLVIVNGVIHQRLGAWAAAMRAIGWPWRALAGLGYVPDPLGGWLYDRIAKNRYKLFGRTDHCMIPDAPLRARFIKALP